MDDTMTVGGGTFVGSDSGTAVTETPEQSTGTGDAVPETKQTEGGSPQGATEGDQGQAGGRRKWSIQDEVKELRAQRRELRERLGSFDQVRSELAQLRDELNRRNQPQTAKTPANFFADPEARLQALKDEIQEVVANQNASLMDAFHQTREQEYAQQALRQEQASAAEFIRSQQGYDSSDDEDLIEIIEGIPNRQHLSPQWVAEYAWMKLNKERGVGDRSLQKRQAAGVQGQPPGAGFGKKVWSKTEFDNAVDLLEKAPNDPKNAELLKELESAHKEGRVR
jgi:hypothetical protein